LFNKLNINSNAAIFILILFLSFLNYGLSLKGGFIGDDSIFLSDEEINTFDSLTSNFLYVKGQHYSPVYSLVNTTIFKYGYNYPWLLKSFNIFLFSISAFCFYLLVLYTANNRKLSLLSAVLFLLHPINTNNLIVIPANFIFIYVSLVILVIFTYDKYLLSFRYCWFILSISLYVLALLTFEGAILLPAYLLILFFFIKKKSIKESFLRIIPFVLIALFYLYIWNIATAGSKIPFGYRAKFLGIDFGCYVWTLFKLFIWYAYNLIIPSSVVHIKNIIPDCHEYWIGIKAILIIFLIAILCLRLRNKNNIYHFYFWWIIAGFVLFPPASLAHYYMGLVIEPHWFYLSSIGWFVLCSSILLQLKKYCHRVLWYLFIFVIGLYLFAFNQQYMRRSLSSKEYNEFWAQNTTDNPIPKFTLAVIAANSMDTDSAISYFNELVKFKEYDPEATYLGLGVCYTNLKDYKRAEEYLLESVRSNPAYYLGYNSLGVLNVAKKDYLKAENYFKMALLFCPSDYESGLNLADTYVSQFRYKEAINVLEKLDNYHQKKDIRIEIMSKLAIFYYLNKEIDKSYLLIKKLTDFDRSQDVFLKLASLFDEVGLWIIAKDIISAGMTINGPDKESYVLLGIILANNKYYKQAVLMWEKALEIDSADKQLSTLIIKAKSFLKD